MGANVSLTPELERFAGELVAQGRYNDVNEVVRQGLRMLRDAEAGRHQFTASLDAAMAEAERDGYATLEEVLGDLDEIIASAAE